MLDSVRGKVESISDDRVVVDIGPVSLVVISDSGTTSRLRIGDEIELKVVVVFGDEPKIFGFSSEEKREMFKNLIKVSKVGPKLALKMISYADLGTLIEMINSGDVDGLSKIPGVGRKTAERIVAELRGEMPLVPKRGAFEEVVEALEALGYPRSEAFKAVERVFSPEIPAEDLIKKALKVIGRI